MAPGRKFINFQFGTTGWKPEPVRSSFGAVTDPFGTFVGGMERPLLGDSGYVIGFRVGSRVAMVCGREVGADGLGPVKRS